MLLPGRTNLSSATTHVRGPRPQAEQEPPPQEARQPATERTIQGSPTQSLAKTPESPPVLTRGRFPIGLGGPATGRCDDVARRRRYRLTIAEHRASIVINKPVADVWAFVANLAETPQWRTTVTSVMPPAQLTVGSEFDATTRVLGRNWSWRLRITSAAPNKELGYEVVEGIVDIQVDYQLERSDDGCLFTLTGQSRPKNLLTRLIDRAGAWQLKREIDGQVRNLKRILETTEA